MDEDLFEKPQDTPSTLLDSKAAYYTDNDRLMSSHAPSTKIKSSKKNELQPSDAEKEQELKRQHQQQNKHMKKVIVTRKMVKEAEMLGVPIKEYLKALDKEAKRQARSGKTAGGNMNAGAVQHYMQS